ncbi:uncharacterized protein [Lolium perenne]|uniref:uncharacterized protein n=1 Tax=Lolium perenne TaxID=4522 RepID=UPI0021F5B69F|nr:uncharacterized protein LOC127292260 [Lolium perenne]
MERLAGWKNSISASLSNWGKTNDEESSLRIPLLGEVPPASEASKRENLLLLQIFALGASLTLLPYMGKEGLLKDPSFPDAYRWWVNVVFPTWWLVVCLGVPCSVWGRWWIEIKYARLSTHLAMLGITLQVIMFSHWMLATEATTVRLCLLLAASGLFFLFWLRCRRHVMELAGADFDSRSK